MFEDQPFAAWLLGRTGRTTIKNSIPIEDRCGIADGASLAVRTVSLSPSDVARIKGSGAAQDAYFAACAEVLGYLEAIAERLENAPVPDKNTNWGHVAEMQHLASQLRAIAEPEE